MIFLKNFEFATRDNEDAFLSSWITNMTCFTDYYPFQLFPDKGLERFDFDEPITILYGGNGCGKTTALNVISEKLHLRREALFNNPPMMESYLGYCNYESDAGIPMESCMVTSDDIFDKMLNLRAVNQKVNLKRSELFEIYNDIKYRKTRREVVNNIDHDNQKSIQEYKRNMSILKNSKSKFVRENLIGNLREHSNGESALLYFQEKIGSDALYLLDEPENSLSSDHQIQLAEYIEQSAWACNCQFVIATHSPFLLAMKRAKIYDLDENPVDIKKWTELKSVLQYQKFFKEHEEEFK